MRAGPLAGVRQLLRGFALLKEPGIRRFVFVPFTINLVVFTALIWFAASRFDALVDRLQPALPEWLAWLAWIAWALFAALAALLVFYTFTLLANLVSAPFNGLLAERVARRFGVEPPPNADPSLLRGMLVDLRQELRKLAYFLRFALILAAISLILLFIPLVNALIPLLWFLYGAWMLALEYSDFHLANQGHDFATERRLLRENLGTALGFGAAATAATLVPVVNFLVMPAAVAGATALWCERLPARENPLQKGH